MVILVLLTQFVREESNGDIIEYELENIGEVNKVQAPTQLASAASSTPQAASLDLVPDFIPNICEISEGNNSDEFANGNINIEHGNIR